MPVIQNAMKTLLLFVVLLSLSACGGGSGGGFVVVEEFSDCPLCKAAKDGDLERVLFLLDSGENPNAVSKSVNANPKATALSEIPLCALRCLRGAPILSVCCWTGARM